MSGQAQACSSWQRVAGRSHRKPRSQTPGYHARSSCMGLKPFNHHLPNPGDTRDGTPQEPYLEPIVHIDESATLQIEMVSDGKVGQGLGTVSCEALACRHGLTPLRATHPSHSDPMRREHAGGMLWPSVARAARGASWGWNPCFASGQQAGIVHQATRWAAPGLHAVGDARFLCPTPY